ncbi:MAG: hypothetical protein U0S50_08725 [Sphingopyxis sp.]|uniref:hypothetical protein n=1 Tax=Sphingopyxis sp. TaxID=1908224 RepID=UPI002ABA841C|nr:hypothetical protein [Sphingopyxis sp.]MDZ3831886.1 hypothetical protein [Sphingopyxis sp.]
MTTTHRIGRSPTVFASIALAAVPLVATLAIPAPALAQRTDAVPKLGTCPFNWREGGTGPNRVRGIPGNCYPISADSPRIIVRASSSEVCPTGYFPEGSRYCTTRKSIDFSAETRSSPDARLAKPVPNARCPLGWASTRDLTACYTTFEKPTLARLSNGKACKPGELAEWGIWCTSNYEGIDRTRADNAGAKDFNEVYAWTLRNRGDTKTVGDTFSPAAEAYYDSLSGGSAPAPLSKAAAAPNGATSAQTEAERCTSSTGAAAGAAVGGAVGGSQGARIGGVLGGLAKGKKKPQGC